MGGNFSEKRKTFVLQLAKEGAIIKLLLSKGASDMFFKFAFTFFYYFSDRESCSKQ